MERVFLSFLNIKCKKKTKKERKKKKDFCALKKKQGPALCNEPHNEITNNSLLNERGDCY